MNCLHLLTLKIYLFVIVFFLQTQLVASFKNQQVSSLEIAVLQADTYCQKLQNENNKIYFVGYDSHRNSLLKAMQESSLSDEIKREIKDQAHQDDCCILMVTPCTLLASIFTLGHTPMNIQSHVLCKRVLEHIQEKLKEKED